MGAGTSSNTATQVIIQNAAGVQLAKVTVNDDGTNLVVSTIDGQRIVKE